ncbi:UDP-galactopyranose mutase [Campylobacter sp. US25a]|uniref:UDP-galactopyranose mutase n=1 Tax=Campylobacter sp. US25a TaxID=2498119 RepID=UPI00106826EF|nr:UDP-galactopyranose mutase [Campylobacter sp. US25a]TEY07362.1 UDP-galactopyranose mutase [Campylobacter sp. US25a]
MDVLIIGCGITGAVIARSLADIGKKVVIWERRQHIGGNMYDYIDNYGILVHKYGPHVFHTSKKYLFDFISQYAQWNKYKIQCGVLIDKDIFEVPFNFSAIDKLYNSKEACNLKKALLNEFYGKESISVLDALNSNTSIISSYAKFLFEKDYRPYTSKQWGCEPKDIDLSILQRVPLRLSYNIGYFDDEFQVVPKISYFDFFKNILNHTNIEIVLNKEALDEIKIKNNTIYLNRVKTTIPIVYTGALDELFNYCFGKLPYRTLKFEWKYENIDSKQIFPVVAYPFDNFTRITEYKKITSQKISGTTYALEYALEYKKEEGFEPYYPLLTNDSKAKYELYKIKSYAVKNLFPVGRLADFKYYNMDQALERAIDTASELMKRF